MFQTGICQAYKGLINNYDPTPLEEKIKQRINGEKDAMEKGALQNGRSVARNALQYSGYTTPPVFRTAYEHTELMFVFDDN